jgi:hypothetical protein
MSRPTLHRGEIDGDGWDCSCGKTSAATPGTLDAHHTAAASSRLRRMDAIPLAAEVTMTAVIIDKAEDTAVTLLRPWLADGKLRAYVRGGFDEFGALAARVDWTAILSDLDTGALDTRTLAAGPDRPDLVLRAAASVAGHGAVSLADLEQLPADHRRVLHEHLTRVLGAAAVAA